MLVQCDSTVGWARFLAFGFCLTVWAIKSITRLVCFGFSTPFEFGLFRLVSFPQPPTHYHQLRPFTDRKSQKPQPPHPSSPPIRIHYPPQTTPWPQIIYNHTPMAEGPNRPQEIIPYLPPTGTNTINHINPTTNKPQNTKIAKQQGHSVLNQHKSMKK